MKINSCGLERIGELEVDEKDMIERITRLEADVKNIHEGNKLFRDEIRQAVNRVSKQNDAIYEIATSVKLITQDMQGLKSDVKEVKDDQKALQKKMNLEMDAVHRKQGQLKESLKDVDHKDANKTLKIWESVRDKLIWLVVGATAAYFLYQAFPFLK